MPTSFTLKESQLSPFFDSGQRKILRAVLQQVVDSIDVTIGALEFNDLSDVVCPTPVAKDTIEFDGTNWTNEDPFTDVSTVSDTSYTSVLANADSFIKFTAATAVTYTIAPQSSVAWRDGTQIEFMQYGAGQVTVVGGSGVTVIVDSYLSLKTSNQYAVAGLKRIAEDEWVLFGNLEA